MVRVIPLDFWAEEPPGADTDRRISGMPEILAVKTIEPFARAEIGRPDGAQTTERDSTMSTYSSLEVWRTFDLRQGIEVWLAKAGAGPGRRDEDREDEDPNAGEELSL